MMSICLTNMYLIWRNSTRTFQTSMRTSHWFNIRSKHPTSRQLNCLNYLVLHLCYKHPTCPVHAKLRLSPLCLV